MKNSRIAQTLRSLSLKPGLESESDVDTGAAGAGQVEAAVEAAEALPADGASAPAEDKDLTAVVVTEDAGPAEEAAETVSTESTDVEASAVTGGGDQAAAVEIAAVDETPADGASAPAEDQDLSTAQVTEDKGPTEEAAETVISDSPVVASTESEAGEAAAEEVAEAAAEEVAAIEEVAEVAAEVPAEAAAEEAAPAAAEAADESSAVTGDGEEAAAVEVVVADEIPADGAAAPGEDAEVVAVVEEVADRTELEAAETEVTDSQTLEPSAESLEDGEAAVAAAAAFADGAAGAAEAVAAAVDVAAGAEAPAADSVEEVIEVATDAAAEDAADAAAEGAAEAVEEVAGEEAAEVVEETIEEAAAEVTDVVAEAVESELDNNEEAIAESAEIEELEEATVEGEQQVEEYEQAAATLESLVDALQEAQQNGGLTRQAAQFYQIGFESVGVRLTGRPFQNAHGEAAMPSLESFGGTMRRDQATTISMENAKEWLAKVWEVIKKTFAQIKEWLVKFFQLVLDKGERIRARALKVKAAADKIGTDKPKAAQLKFGGASKIAIGGKVATSDLNDLAAFAKEAGERNSEASRAIIQARQDLRTMIQTAAAGGKFQEGTASSGDSALKGELRSAVFNQAYKGEEGEGFKTKLLPGNVEFLAINPLSGDVSISGIAGVVARGWKVVQLHDEAVEFDGELPVLTAFHIKEIADAAIRVVDAAKAAKAELKDEALSIADLDFPEDLDQSDARKIKSLAWLTGKILQTQSSSIGKVLKYCVGTSDAYLDYAVASLKQYGAEAPAEAAAPAAA